MEKKCLKVIVSGGGTGGHIFPAISIANALRDEVPNVEILFVGAEGRMEMEKVPNAGYPIVGLPVVGLQRKLTAKNLLLPFKLISSLLKATRVVKSFKPDVVVGVGGYASGPILRVAQGMGIPTLIQEQNSYAGVTNRLLGKRAKAICVAYEGMEKYFPSDKIVLTGNPVRKGFDKVDELRKDAYDFFGIPFENRVVLVIGGSLGARTINQSILDGIEVLAKQNDVTLLWQTGKLYHDAIMSKLEDMNFTNIKVFDFINRMDLAYAASNVVVSRAGACSISELCLVAKPCILVPSPNVAEDHQTKNAMALVKKGAALMIADNEAPRCLVDGIVELLNNEEKQQELSRNIKNLALTNSDRVIARKVIEIAVK